MIKKYGVFLFLCSVVLAGCASIPKDAFLLSPTSLEERRIQTRFYQTENEIALLSAGIAVLQDMGYSVVETEKDVGLVTASKNVDATDSAQVAAAVFVALLGGGAMPIDKEQKIKVSLVTNRSKTKDGYLVRVTFQRFIWNSEGRLSRAETIKAPELYEEFFQKLSKSVFLEAFKI